jgi:hypothetical protein
MDGFLNSNIIFPKITDYTGLYRAQTMLFKIVYCLGRIGSCSPDFFVYGPKLMIWRAAIFCTQNETNLYYSGK